MSSGKDELVLLLYRRPFESGTDSLIGGVEERMQHLARRVDQAGDDSSVDVQITFVFGKVPEVVALGQGAPYARPHPQCVG